MWQGKRAIANVGRMTERIEIQTKANGDEWQQAARPYAELIPITGKEFQAAESTRPAASVRWRIRYDAQVARLDTRTTRIVHGEDVYNVTYIEDAQNAHVQLYIVSEREEP